MTAPNAMLEFSRLHAAMMEEGGDYFAALCAEVARWAGTAQQISQLMAALETAQPDAYHEAMSGSTLPARLRRQAMLLAQQFAEEPRTQERLSVSTLWASEHEVEPKALQRALDRYKADDAFRSDVDQKAEVWRRALRKDTLD